MSFAWVLVAALAVFASSARAGDADWQLLEPGLELGEFVMPTPSTAGDSRLTALRIDTARFQLRLLNASAPGEGRALNTRAWCDRAGLVAAINASMYQTDLKTSVSMMRNADHVNNPRLTRDRAVLAFDAVTDSVPPADILDLTCIDFDKQRHNYRGFVQSIRMVSCTRQNVWQQQPNRFSTAAIAVDDSSRILFLHCRSPYSTHDFIAGLLVLPLGIARAMYAEGGPQAQLFVRSGGREIERVGRFEGMILEDDDIQSGWPIPNAIGVARLPAPR